MNTHRAVCNRLLWMQDAYRLTAADAVLQKTPFSFDVSVWEFFWPLITGARLVVARPEGHRDPAYLAGLIDTESVTMPHFVPSMLQSFLETADLSRCRSLTRVICSGEALSAHLQQAFFATALRAALYNLYGPTEAAVDVTHWTCEPDPDAHTVPIGRPIANARIYVLDDRLRPVPVGVPGELYIGGVCVARGYLNRPELTAEKFVVDPFAPELGARMYKTGDLVRWRPDGALEYFGRLDHQVKLRGFRIELGEVEACLLAQDDVAEAAVLLRNDAAERLLVAYVAAREGAVLSPQLLRERLATELPAYMIPAAFVTVPTLPLTANGKLDRRALPAPAATDTASASTFVAPRDRLELELVDLWQELLRLEPIGIDDDFFALGGSSLQLLRLSARLAKRYGHELPLSSLFERPTIRGLASALREQPADADPSPLVRIRGGDGIPLFCVHPAIGNVLSYSDLARHLPPDQAVYGIEAAGLAGKRPIGDVSAMASSHFQAIRAVAPTGPYLIAGYCLGTVFAYEIAQQLARAGDEVAMLALLDGGPPNPHSGFERAGEAELAAWFAWELGRAAGRALSIDPAELSGLTGERLAQAVLDRAVAADALPPDIGVPQIKRLLDVFITNVGAARAYQPRRFPGSVVGIRAEEGPDDGHPLTRWIPFAAGGMTHSTVPGDHYSMMRPPNVAVLAETLTGLIEQALSVVASPRLAIQPGRVRAARAS